MFVNFFFFCQSRYLLLQFFYFLFIFSTFQRKFLYCVRDVTCNRLNLFIPLLLIVVKVELKMCQVYILCFHLLELFTQNVVVYLKILKSLKLLRCYMVPLFVWILTFLGFSNEIIQNFHFCVPIKLLIIRLVSFESCFLIFLVFI